MTIDFSQVREEVERLRSDPDHVRDIESAPLPGTRQSEIIRWAVQSAGESESVA